LQLEYICSFSTDDDIRERLGQLPPTLETLYTELYNKILNLEGEYDSAICKNALSWLLCAQQVLHTEEFLSAVSIVPNKGLIAVSKGQVLELCNNFVVFDEQLDTFRLAHLSVREFLERQPIYSNTSINGLAAEVTLLNVISTSPNPDSRSFLSRNGQEPIPQSNISNKFKQYSNLYWVKHCQLVRNKRTEGKLRETFRFFMSRITDPSSPLGQWIANIRNIALDDLMKSNIWGATYDLVARSAPIIFVAAAFDFPEIFMANQNYEMLLAKLDLSFNNVIPVCINHGSCESLAILLKRHGNKVNITEDMLLNTVQNRNIGENVMMTLFNQQECKVTITERVVSHIASNGYKEMMALFLEHRGDEFKITEDVVMAAAQGGSEKTMALLLEHRGDEFKITEDVVVDAVEGGSEKMMALLLEHRGDEFKITEDVVVAAAQGGSVKMIALLLEHRGDEFKITEGVVVAAAQGGSVKMMALLLEHRGNEFKITEGVVVAAAQGGSVKMMALLLEHRGDEFKITEKVLKAVTQNWERGVDMMGLLLQHRANEIIITEEVLKTAAQNVVNGPDLITLLLEYGQDDVKITEDVVKAAAGSERGESRLAILLSQRGDEVKITQNVVKVAVGSRYGVKVMMLLLKERGEEVQITEEILQAAARGRSGVRMMFLLLEQRGDEVQITKEVIKAAVGNEGYGNRILKLLVDQRRQSIQVTTDIIEAAATCGQRKILDLFESELKVPIERKWRLLAEFYNAAKRGHVKRARELLASGVNPDVKSIYNRSPLWRAACSGHTEMVKILLSTRAVDVNAMSFTNHSPIFWPAAKGYEEIVRMLIKAKSNTSYVDKNGVSPLEIAEERGHDNIVRMLESNNNLGASLLES
jgi:Ankyrin repeats (many copies)